ncbi:uncharacterized protein LOC124156396 [Ischnura elegans]|uniref:uncharacterized protein LOC124156396 n=1 Tax=Ischnura elegans TaxID=197161 RepID=UPI001ED880C1|nr:uncharacterized protein LOC124156396 [Ischnura elegans]XP_046386892.1 uncharacterized protein LOC124156396 [Ischnura elegans]
MQTMDVDMATASGEESYDGEILQSFSAMEISSPLPPPFNENIKPCDSVKFDCCHTLSSSSNTELEQFPEPQEGFRPRERIAHFSSSAQGLAVEREKVSSPSQCSCCGAINLVSQVAAFIMGLKNYNQYRNGIEAMTLEKAELERLSAEANLHHNELQVDVQQIVKDNAVLQIQILILKREQVEQKIAQQKEMHLMKLKMKNLKMQMANYQAGKSLNDDSNSPPATVEQSRQERNTTDMKVYSPIGIATSSFENPTSL